MEQSINSFFTGWFNSLKKKPSSASTLKADKEENTSRLARIGQTEELKTKDGADFRKLNRRVHRGMLTW